MTVLAAAQAAGQLLLGRKPVSLFGTDAFGLELGTLANEAAEAIGEYHEWQRLKVLASYAGTGAATAFNVPVDFGRMLKKGAVHSTTWKNANYRQAVDEDEWLYLQDTNISGTPGVWILLGGQLQIFPAMPVGETARHYYISSRIVAALDGGPPAKTAFSADGDGFVLPERLLRLSLLWRWRARKGLDYSEDLANYEIALAEEVASDQARQPLVVGRRRIPPGQAIAWPGRLGP